MKQSQSWGEGGRATHYVDKCVSKKGMDFMDFHWSEDFSFYNLSRVMGLLNGCNCLPDYRGYKKLERRG